MRFLLIAIAACACGGGHLQTIRIVNRTDRPIEELYVYPMNADHGASRGSLAPNASKQVEMPEGGVSVTGVSAHLQVDDLTRDRPSASVTIELRSPTEVVFHDQGHNAPPPGDNRKVGAMFIIPKGKAPPTTKRSQHPSLNQHLDLSSWEQLACLNILGAATFKLQ